jgi:hypothetical protein
MIQNVVVGFKNSANLLCRVKVGANVARPAAAATLNRRKLVAR